MIIADAGGLLALFGRREPAHPAVSALVSASDEALVVSPFVLAEVDYLAATSWGPAAELAILRELVGAPLCWPTWRPPTWLQRQPS